MHVGLLHTQNIQQEGMLVPRNLAAVFIECAVQAGDITGGADFARAKRYKKLAARLSSAQAKSKMAKLRSQSMYVMLFLIAIHTGAFAATRVLVAKQKSQVTAVWHVTVFTNGSCTSIHVMPRTVTALSPLLAFVDCAMSCHLTSRTRY